ncbi:MAG: hypothetical protein IPG07_19065 [Crocinitomicaceae bacterium]|nr:hypothetical protein [Crocinitomicaceae bacterium]MBK6952786.1 hypothetical protein [Crocinitomicaceae bacterium]
MRLEILEYFTNTSGFTDIDTHYHSATLSIDWDDNSPIQVINNYTGQEISHFYNDLGTYFPTATIVFNDRYGDEQTLEDGNSTDGKEIEFQVQTACTDADAHQYYPTISSDGNWLMGSKIWINNNFFGSHIGSYTHSWKKNNSGAFERHKSDIYAKVYGKFRNDDCVHNETKEKSDLQQLQKKNQVTKHKIRKFYGFANGDVTSSHYMVKGSIFLQKNLVLNPCQ